MPRQPPLCTPFSDPSLWCIYLYHKGSDGCVCPTYHIPPVGISARGYAPLSFPHFCRDSVLIDFPWKISHNSNFSACTKKTPSPPCFLHFAFCISAMGTVHLHLFPPAGKMPLFLCGQMHATELYLPLFYKFFRFYGISRKGHFSSFS